MSVFTVQAWKLLLTALVLGGTFLGGLYIGKGQKEVVTIEKTGKTVVKYKDRIVTVTKIIKPDGTIEETTKTEDREGSTKEKTVDNSSTTKSLASDYSIGAKYWIRGLEEVEYRNVEITAGRRMFGEIWLDVGVLPLEREVAVGLSFKF